MGREARAGNDEGRARGYAQVCDNGCDKGCAKGCAQAADDVDGSVSGEGDLPAVQVVEPNETITDRHYRSFFMPCEPLEDSGSAGESQGGVTPSESGN